MSNSVTTFGMNQNNIFEASAEKTFCEDVVVNIAGFVVHDRHTKKTSKNSNGKYDRKSVRMVSKNNYSKRNHSTLFYV